MSNKNKTQEFIGFYYMDNTEICDKVIAHFEASEEKKDGIILKDGLGVNKKIKESTDLTIHSDQHPVINEYCNELLQALRMYITDFPYSNFYSQFGMLEGFNIQKYEPNQGYHQWHTERGNAIAPYCYRHLVFMTYLNDVTDAGETEFYHQKLKVQPQKGLTLIWPADWTHTHKGITSPTQVKYITTGWFSFLE